MKTFLEKTVAQILEKLNSSDLTEVIFLVPSHRAGQKIKQILQNQYKEPFFLPKIYLASDFYHQWRFGEKKIAQVDLPLLMLLFQTHQDLFTHHSLKNWESFYELGKTILQDFNEIDNHLLPIEKFFALSAVDDFGETASAQNRRQSFVDLELYYRAFAQKMLEHQIFYTGAWMRQLAEKTEKFTAFFHSQSLIFGIGFAALSPVEKKLITYLKTHYQAEFFYDWDDYFAEKGVGGFFKDNPEAKVQKTNILLAKKDFYLESIGTENAVDLVLSAIEKIPKSTQQRNKTAIFLADEKLLPLFLVHLPQDIVCNISAGLSLNLTLGHHFFFFVFEVVLDPSKINLDFWHFWSSVIFLQKFNISKTDQKLDFILYLKENAQKNGFFNYLVAAFEAKNILQKAKNYQIFVEKLAFELEEEKEKNIFLLLTATLKDLIEIHEKNGIFPFQNGIFLQLLKQKTTSLTVPILGNPQEGLQVLGILESRALDFETLIFCNIEEKIFPTDSYHFSLIPHFIREKFELPGKKELQYLYGYYFYRLLIRSQKAYFLYNKTLGELGSSGELSRFVQQVFLELPQKNFQIQCLENSVILKNIKKNNNKNFCIDKEKANEKLISYLKKGLSPTALVHWVECPADFFYSYVLRLSKKEEDPKVQIQLYLGDWAHQLLEHVFSPLQNTQDTYFWKRHLETCTAADFLEKTLSDLLEKQKKPFEKQGIFALWQQIAVDMVRGFLRFQYKKLTQPPPLILGMELREKTHLLGTDFVLEGKLDFLAAHERYHQIVDYKTAFIDKKKWKIPENINSLFDGEKKHPYQKYWIQLLFYALLYHKKNPKTPIAAGIYSMQHISADLLQMGNPQISVEVLEAFEQGVWSFINAFLQGDRAFLHLNESKYCHFCLENGW